MAGQLEQLRPPVVAEVVECIPINTILGNGLEREKSPWNRPLMMVGRVIAEKPLLSLGCPVMPGFRGHLVRILA